jgi:hypothetical protein
MIRNVAPDQIESQIVRVLDEIGENFGTAGLSNCRWTEAVKKGLQPLAQNLSCICRASGTSEPEWLYDVTWTTGVNGTVCAVPLVLESEWSAYDDDVLYDFRKLLLARASNRVMVFEREGSSISAKLIDQMCDEIRAFGASCAGDKYLFAAWEYGPKPKRFRYEAVRA